MTTIGRYQVKRELGRGGMATVYLAHDPQIERDVALKILPREFLHDRTFRGRFKREARTIASLEHPAIVPIYDFGEHEDQPYLVMRYMSGGSLAEKVAAGPLSVERTIEITERMAAALDYAHEQGVIHRDLKPANILFDGDGNPFLADFGIAKLAESTSTLTGNAVIGSPAYMSPEQIRGDQELDGRSDIYMLGIIVFEMLTGRAPYRGDSPTNVMMAHLLDPIPRLQGMKPDLPAGYEMVIRMAMAKDREERFRTGTALARALVVAAKNTPLASAGSSAETYVLGQEEAAQQTYVEQPTYVEPPPAQMGAQPEPGPARPDVDAEADRKPGRRIPVWAMVIGGLVLFCIIAGAVVAVLPQTRDLILGAFPTDTAVVPDQPVADATSDQETVAENVATEEIEPSATATIVPTETPSPSPTPSPTATPIPMTSTPAPRRPIPINNGDFEQNFTDWRSTTNAYIIQDGRSGFAAAVGYVEGGISDIRRQFTMVFERGRVYKASVWCKADLGEQCRLFFGDATETLNPPAYQNQAVAVAEGNGQWQQLNVVVPMSQDEYMSVYLYSQVAGDVLYDDLMIEEVACENICNGGFEEGLIFWRSTDNVEATVGRTGQGIRVLSDDARSDVIQLLPGIFPAGSTYKATVWCRALVGTECKMFFGDALEIYNPPSYESSKEVSLEGNGDWQELEATITLQQDELLSIYLYSQTPNSFVFYDSVQVQLVDAP